MSLLLLEAFGDYYILLYDRINDSLKNKCLTDN